MTLLTAVLSGCSSNPGIHVIDVGGTWKGTLSQSTGPLGDVGYRLSFEISQIDSKILGSSRIEIKDTPYYATMTLSGHVSGDTVHFAEGGITEEKNRPGASWCVKQGTLVFSTHPDSLRGSYHAPQCEGGSIWLHRVTQVAP